MFKSHEVGRRDPVLRRLKQLTHVVLVLAARRHNLRRTQPAEIDGMANFRFQCGCRPRPLKAAFGTQVLGRVRRNEPCPRGSAKTYQ